MSDVYIPGVWSQRYNQLSASQKADADQEVDRIFRQRTGVQRPLDPKNDKVLVRQWLQIRDEVMARMAGKGASNSKQTGPGKAMGLPPHEKDSFEYLFYNFDIGDSDLKPEHRKYLNATVVAALQTSVVPVNVFVFGHASRTGDDVQDAALSQSRAMEVDLYLRNQVGTKVNLNGPFGLGKRDQVSTDVHYRMRLAKASVARRG